MQALYQDVRYGIRMLRKAPGFTAIALITLAIGIGANTIMFSVVNVLLFRLVQVKAPDQLVACNFGNARGYLRYSVYEYMRDNNAAFSDLMVCNQYMEILTLARENAARRVRAMFVSANYFSGLGMPPVYGRGFLPEEEWYGAEPVAVLSHRAWEQCGADPGVVGTYLAVNGTPFRVIGVAQKEFTGPSILGPDLWLPLGSYGLVGHLGETKPEKRLSEIWNYYCSGIVLVGRLKPGLTMAEAQARLQSLVPYIKENYPRWWTDNGTLSLDHLLRISVSHSSINDAGERRLSYASLFLMSISAIVLLIACFNLANMVIVRGAARHREIAIRMAIGGGRLRIMRQLFIESFLLATLGGALGLVLAFWGTRTLNAWLGAEFGPTDPTRSLGISLDLRVLAATLGFCLIAAVLSGLKPAWRLSRREVVTDLKESGGGVLRSTGRVRRPRGLSVVCQIALSVVLVMGAGLFGRAALKTIQADPGFSYAGKLVIEVDALAAGHDPARSAQVCEALTERLSAVPGIQAVGLSASFPFGGGDYSGEVREYAPGLEGETASRHRGSPTLYTVGASYFEAMGLPLLQGRFFQRLDSAPNAEKVVIIDERLAHKLRPDGNALGCLIQYGEDIFGPPYRVVGIVPHLRAIWDDHIDRAHIYLPMGPDCQPAYIHLRAASPARGAEVALLSKIRAEIRRIDPDLPVLSVATLTDHRRNNSTVWFMETLARLVIAFGAMALFLASLGIYAVKGYMVASRTPEIGIRKALGATHWSIMGMVMREGMVLTLTGLFAGLLLGLAAARLIGSLLYGVHPVDPISIVVTVALLGVASLLASYLPARRAARIDPMVALRYE